MAEVAKDTVRVSEIIAISDFAKSLGKHGVRSESIRYHLGIMPGSPDNLDFVQLGRDRFIVNNERAKDFQIGKHYWTRRRKSNPEEAPPAE